MNEDIFIEKLQDALKPQFEKIDVRLDSLNEKIDQVFKEVLIVKEEVQEIREIMPSKDEIVGALDTHTKAINDLEEERVANLAWRRRVDEKLSLGGSPAAA